MRSSAAAAVVSIFAAIQFALPSTSALNSYAPVEGEEIDGDRLFATGRSRVSSTFSFVSGFANFTDPRSHPDPGAGSGRARSAAAQERLDRHWS